ARGGAQQKTATKMASGDARHLADRACSRAAAEPRWLPQFEVLSTISVGPNGAVQLFSPTDTQEEILQSESPVRLMFRPSYFAHCGAPWILFPYARADDAQEKQVRP